MMMVSLIRMNDDGCQLLKNHFLIITRGEEVQLIKELLGLLDSIGIIRGIIVVNVDNIVRDDTVLVLKTVPVLQGLKGAARPVAGSSVVLVSILHVGVSH